MGRKLTDEEMQYIKDNCTKMSDQAIADHIGRSVTIVAYYRVKFGVKRGIPVVWAKADAELLEQHLDLKPDALMKMFPQYTKDQIANQKHYLKNVKPCNYGNLFVAEPFVAKPIPKNYKPQHIDNKISKELILAVNLQSKIQQLLRRAT